MTVREVPGYEVVCNGCGRTTGDLGEYAFWGDKGTAIDEWTDADGIVLDDDRAWCEDCLISDKGPAEICRLGDRPDYAHTPDEEKPGFCVECEKPLTRGDET